MDALCYPAEFNRSPLYPFRPEGGGEADTAQCALTNHVGRLLRNLMVNAVPAVFTCILEPSGYFPVFATRGQVAEWMVVHQHECGSRFPHRGVEDLVGEFF
jgi:hypothetical protein